MGLNTEKAEPGKRPGCDNFAKKFRFADANSTRDARPAAYTGSMSEGREKGFWVETGEGQSPARPAFDLLAFESHPFFGQERRSSYFKIAGAGAGGDGLSFFLHLCF